MRLQHLIYSICDVYSFISELFVKVVDMEDTMKVDRLEGYTSGVRSAAWHPSGSLLVCSVICSIGRIAHTYSGHMHRKRKDCDMEHGCTTTSD